MIISFFAFASWLPPLVNFTFCCRTGFLATFSSVCFFFSSQIMQICLRLCLCVASRRRRTPPRFFSYFSRSDVFSLAFLWFFNLQLTWKWGSGSSLLYHGMFPIFYSNCHLRCQRRLRTRFSPQKLKKKNEYRSTPQPINPKKKALTISDCQGWVEPLKNTFFSARIPVWIYNFGMSLYPLRSLWFVRSIGRVWFVILFSGWKWVFLIKKIH